MFFPRNKESKKPIPLPDEFNQEISNIFIAEFQKSLKDNQSLKVKNLLYETEIICSLHFTTQGQLKQQVFEVSLDYTPIKGLEVSNFKQSELTEHSEKIQNLIGCAADYLSLCLDIFLKENEVPSSEWTKMDFQKQVLFIRHHTLNLDLEEQANKLLGSEFLKDLKR